MWGPALYDKCPSGAIPKPGKDAIVSFWAIFYHPAYLCQGTFMNFLHQECLFRGIMFPHNAQGLGWYKAESGVIGRMSKDHDNAIGGVVTGSEPSFHKLGAHISTLIGWEDCHWSQSQGGDSGSV
jgi:hypothetical protein